MAHIFDPVRTYSELKNTVVNGVSSTFPIETKNRVLRVSNVQVDDSKADPFNYKLQKDIKVHEGDYVAPVYGDLELVDKATGEVIDRRKKFRLMDIPVLTDRYSFILGGNEYTVDKQLRMKPGVYTREKENGELESQFNLAKGGRGFKMLLNPEDNIFKLKIQSSFPPLYPILKALGIEDGKIKEAWGDKLFLINQSKTLNKSDNVVMKAYKSIFGKDPQNPSEATVELRKFFEGTVLSGETTKRTLGEAFESVTPDALLKTSNKLLKVSRGEELPDDRDSLVFKHIYDTPDLIDARITANKKKVQYTVGRVMDRKDKINEIISKDLLNKPVRAFFTQGTVSSTSEQTNPAAILAQATKVTSLGEGAIGDMNAVTDSMRSVNPSHVGVLDPVATPECLPEKALVYTRDGWISCSEITMDTEILCRPDGPTKSGLGTAKFMLPRKVVNYKYSGVLYGMDNGVIGYLVTPEHRIWSAPVVGHGIIEYSISRADAIHGKERSFITSMHGVKTSTACSEHYYTEEYVGKVYCVTVPGSLIFVKMPGRLGMWMGNSEKIGINLHLALGAVIDNKELKTLVKNKKSNKSGYMMVKDLYDKKVAFPDQYDNSGKPKGKDVIVMYQGKMTKASDKDVDYVLHSPKQVFSYLSNMVPFLANIQGNRAFMANKMLAQSIPLKYREEPLIQTKMPAGGTFERFIGKVFSVNAKTDGTVTSVSNDTITVKDKSGTEHSYNLYNNFPLNNKSFLHAEPKVKEGDKVEQGQVLADSNFTKNGVLSIGTNLRVGMVPFKDNTFEDGYVISESASKKLTSEHLREVTVQTSRDDKLDLKSFRAHYPTALSAKSAAKLDESGVIKKGAILEPGDVVIAHLQKMEALPEDAKLGKLSKTLVKGFRNNAQLWDKDVIGEVVDVVRTGEFVKVYVKTEEPAQIGDKLVNRHGAKGIISAVIPDNEMPSDKSGNPIDLAISPSAVTTRINPSQILETAMGKVALKKGKPIKIDNFIDIDSVDNVKNVLKKEGIEDKEELIDPKTGQSLGKVLTGDQYYLKLVHQVSKKINARGVGPSYDIDLQPTKGGHTSARNVGRLEFNSLIAHGARENLFEMTAYKAEQNPELWRNVQLGFPLPAPKTPFVFNKLLGYLAAGGVNIRKEGNKLFMLPLTDKEILERSNGEIEEAKVVISKNLRPVKDGLFDEIKTGGLKGTKWTHISLAEPMLNPVMENAVKTVLGLTQKQLDDLISGKLFYDKDSKKLLKESSGNTITAGTAIKEMLSNINVDKRYDELLTKAKGLSGQGLDKVNKELRFLRALKHSGLKPADAYVLNNVPVLPPQFRPMYPLPNGNLNTAPINFLYRDMVMVNSQLKELGMLDDTVKSELRSDLYKAVKALQGLGDPLVQRGEKKISGAIELIKGPSPKEGFFQSVVFAKNQDLSGSSTITPSTEMNPDEILMPRQMAWDLYQPFIVKEMTKMGYKPLDAAVAVREHTPQAQMALERAVKDRPIWLNRAPSLHKFSILTVQPKLYDGKSIKIHPLVVGGYGADFDGDSSIGAVFIGVQVEKLKTSKSALDIANEDGYILDITSWISKRSITMPSNVRIPLMQNEQLLHIDLQDFPRVESTKKVSEKGTIVYKVPAGIRVATIDNETHQIVMVDVTEFSVHPDLENYTIETNDGSNLWLSADHSAITLNMETMSLDKTKPEDLAGKMMPKVKNLKVETTLSEIDLTDYSVNAAVRAKESVKLTKEFGHFIGMMVGDGWISSVAHKPADFICFSNLDEGLAQKFENGVNSLLNTEKRRYSVSSPHEFEGHACNSVKHTIRSASLAENIKEWIGQKAHGKHLPPFYLSAPEEFRLGLLAGLIDTDGSSLWIKAASKKKPQYGMWYSTVSSRLAEEIITLCRSLGIGASITVTPKEFRVVISTMSAHGKKIPIEHPEKKKAFDEYCAQPLSPEALRFQATRMDLVPFSEALYTLANKFLSKKRGSPDMVLYGSINDGRRRGFISRRAAREIIMRCPEFPKAWIEIVNNEDVTWVYATTITKSPKRVTMYDITAPGPYTFMTSSGIIVQDTMGVFVPISHKAVEEAKNFLPTRVLEHAADNKIMLAPGHDVMTGMYYLTRSGKDLSKRKYATLDDAMKDYKTKTIEMYDTVTINGQQTTIGKTLVNQIMPEGMSIPTGGLTKSTMGGFLKDLSKKGPDVFRDTMDKLSKLATKYNIYSSISIGLEDITPDYKNREAALKEVVRDYNKATDDNERRKVLQKNVKIMDTVARNFAANNPENAIAQLLTASGKPSFDQFKQMVITPFAVSDELGRAVPFPLTHSFPEGLPISEYWAHTYGSRSGMIQKRLATADPGYFAKQVISATTDNVISKEDCGTKEGVETSLDSSLDVIGRYEAGTNKLIDEAQYRALTKAGKKSIKLRSPLTCELKEGTCSACYGLRENGQKAKIGDNVGALAGQFITEPTTQGSMKAFHTGAVLGSGAQVAGGLERLQQLTLVPKFLKDKATLAAVSGKVEHIEDNPGGGKNIYVNGEKHLMGVRNVLKVKVGDKVEKGDALTDGPIKPQELLALKGIGATQKYLVDNMQETMRDMGRPMNRKLIETVVRSTTNLTTVEDPGNHPYYVPGDKAPLTEILSWNKNSNNEVDTNEALGAHLAVAAGPYAAGTLLDKDKIKALSTLGIDKVVVKSSPIKHTPSIVGINILARMSKDWLAKLNTDHIEQMVLDSVQEGAVAPTSSYNPTGAYVLATNFGKGKDGKY